MGDVRVSADARNRYRLVGDEAVMVHEREAHHESVPTISVRVASRDVGHVVHDYLRLQQAGLALRSFR